MDQGLPIVTIETSALRVGRMKRGVVTSFRLINSLQGQVQGKADRWAMITTTYAPDVDWHPRHISQMVAKVRRFAKAQGFVFRYVWVLEMTRAGRPHYHVAVKLPAGVKLPKPDDAGWWPHGMTRVEFARNPGGYMAKYLSKVDSDRFYPKGARMYGSGGLPAEEQKERRRFVSPRYVRECYGDDSNPFRRKGGGWIDRETGEVLPSRYQLIARGRRQVQLLDLWNGSDVPPDRVAAAGSLSR